MADKPKILISPRSLTRDGHPALQRLEAAGFELVYAPKGRQPTEAELLELLPGCVGFLAGVEPVPARVLDAAAATLTVISRNGTGISNIDLDAARRLGIQVRPTPGANARGVAELAMALILALVRGVAAADRQLKDEQWTRTKGIELDGRVLGVVGCGNIGRRVAQMALAMGMRVEGCDPCRDDTFAPDGFAYAELDTVLAESDIVSLHCPPPADGTPLIGCETLGRMKRGAYLVNTARGELLDEAAVLEALESGQLAGVAMDAFREEPPGNNALVKHERVIATPHIGGYTVESVDRAVGAAVDNLLEVL